MPAGEERDAEHPQVVRADHPVGHGRRRLVGRQRAVDEVEPGTGAAAGHRQRAPHRHAGDAGQGFELLPRALEEGGARRLVVGGRRHAEAEGQQAVGAEARVHLEQLGEAAHQEPGAGEQHQRQRHLGDHQAGAHQPAAPGGAARAFAQRLRRAAARRLQRRGEAEGEPGERARPRA